MKTHTFIWGSINLLHGTNHVNHCRSRKRCLLCHLSLAVRKGLWRILTDRTVHKTKLGVDRLTGWGWQVEICLLNLRSLLNLWRFIQNHSVFRYLSCTPLKMDAWKIYNLVRSSCLPGCFCSQFSGVQNWGPSFWERTLSAAARIIWGLGSGKRCGVQDRCHDSWKDITMFYCQCWKILPALSAHFLQDWHNSFITPVEDSGGPRWTFLLV